MDRFSPYQADPAAFGMRRVRAMRPFTYLYPFPDEVVEQVAYYFDFEYSDRGRDDAFAREAVDLAIGWMSDQARGSLEVSPGHGDAIRVVDTRRGLEQPRTATLRGWKAAVYESCDRSQLTRSLLSLPAVAAEEVAEADVLAFLHRCVTYQLMVTTGERWLSLAVHTPARTDPEPAAQRQLQLV
jgi:hypothetical protein